MSAKKEETASFVLRFTQKVFVESEGEHQVQWRGNIRHVQGGDEKRFSKFEEVVTFIQEKLADLTIIAMEDKTPEEQKGILSKSYELWKKMALNYPKIVMETIKDPKHQVEHLQQQINQMGDAIGQKLEIDNWRTSSKADLQKVMDLMEKMSGELTALSTKVDQLSKRKK